MIEAGVDRTSELDPKCINGKQEAFGFTNRGELIPCCWLDTQVNRRDEDYMTLVLASNINDYDSVEEILLQDEWVDFRNNLKNNKGFAICHFVCKKRDSPQHKREVVLDDDGDVKYAKET